MFPLPGGGLLIVRYFMGRILASNSEIRKGCLLKRSACKLRNSPARRSKHMYCPSCGAALTSNMKFCNRCGSNLAVKDLAAKDQVELIKIFEKRMDSEMEGLFWITIMGIAAIFGGSALLKKLQLSEWIIVGYMIVSAVAVLSYFGLGVWQVRRLARRGEEVTIAALEPEPAETHELNPAQPLQTWETASVTENTTRTLEPVSGGNDH